MSISRGPAHANSQSSTTSSPLGVRCRLLTLKSQWQSTGTSRASRAADASPSRNAAMRAASAGSRYGAASLRLACP